MKRLAIVLALMFAPQAAAQDAETRVYGAAQSCTGLRAYLRNYPNGRFTADARARLARDCAEPAAPKAVPAPRPAAPKTVPSPVRTTTIDQCVQARADWANIASTRDIPVLRAFRDSAPSACAVQRAQAQSRIDVLEDEKRVANAAAAAAPARKRAEWNGVPEFEGNWFLVGEVASGVTCASFPWRFTPMGAGFEWNAEPGRLLSVERLVPPTLKTPDGRRFILESSGTIREEDGSGKFYCTLRRQ